MRFARPILPVLLALAPSILIACSDGGGGPSDPVQPGPAVPASVAMIAGDGQQAAAGSAVAVAPSVAVRDAGGAAVSGVRVTFEVAEGGGSIAGGTPTTGPSGLATVQSWTLGSHGPQRLRATVTGLAPVEFEATITPGTEIVEGSVGVAGGVITLTSSGHPFDGLELTVPDGAFDGTAAFRFRARPAPDGLTLPAGYVVRGPVLEVQTAAGRSDAPMTLEVPVSAQAGEQIVLAFHDPGRNALEVLPTVAQSATSVTVMTSHLSADLLLGSPGPSGVSPSGPLEQGMNLGAIGNLIPISQLLPVEPARVPLNAWPVLDHGSAAHPDGHGVAIPALQAMAPSVLSKPLGEIVRSLSIPGFYAEAAPLAAVQLLHEELSSEAGAAARAVTQALASMSKAERDALVTRNVAASLAVSGRSVPLAARVVGGPFSFLSAIGGADQLLQMRPATSAAEIEMTRTEGAGLGSIEFPGVAGGAPVTADQVVPLSSFLVPWERAEEFVSELGRLDAATTDELRDAINRSLARRAGLPDPVVAARVLGGPFAEVVEPLIVRTPSMQVRVSGGMFGSFTLHLPAGAEVGRGDADTALEVAGAVEGVESGETVERIATLFETIGGLEKQAAAVRLRLLHAPFAITPDSVEAETAPHEVEFEASVPSPPAEGFRIVWEWGDDESSDLLGLLTGTHEFADVGVYDVVATLKTADGAQDLARDSARVRIGNEVWVGEVTYTVQKTNGPWTQTVKVRNLTFDYSPDDDDDVRIYYVIEGDVEGRITMTSGSGCVYDSGAITQPLYPLAGDFGRIHTRREGDRLLYQAQGTFGAPFMIPVHDRCDSGALWEYFVYVWLHTDDGTGGDLAWIEAPDPDRLEGSYTTLISPLRHTWTWRFERVRAEER